METINDSFALYCINFECSHSVYNQIKPTWLALTIDNIVATHICQTCQQPMHSAIDMEITQVIKEVSVRLTV